MKFGNKNILTQLTPNMVTKYRKVNKYSRYFIISCHTNKYFLKITNIFTSGVAFTYPKKKGCLTPQNGDGDGMRFENETMEMANIILSLHRQLRNRI